MEISIQSLLEGAKRATGTVAVIDVFRAFTTAAVVLANGASSIVMVSTVAEALALRDDICMGEVQGRAPPESDFGNSPFERCHSAIDELRGWHKCVRTTGLPLVCIGQEGWPSSQNH